MQRILSGTLGGALTRAANWLAALSGLCLLIMVAVISVSVVTRYLFNLPILGANEIVQMAAVCVIMLALPYATKEQAHVRVDIFDPMLGRWGCMIGDITARLLSGFILGDLVRRGWRKTIEAWEYVDITNMLSLPIWPFYLALTLGAALTVVVFAAEILAIITRRRPI